MAQTPGGRKKRTWALDPEMVAWLERKGKDAETTASTILRQIVRAAMDSDKPKRSRVA